ncbi:MAG: segregation/condensation protein A [Nanoarchaeota archaeon]|nr:segregation/condensation protein A [Nanoarchaeota archaeon]
MLRIKSEILLNHDLPTLDDILFGRKEERHYEQERIELEDEIPDLVQRTPLPRHRKVSLNELLSALGKAITTENRRIKKVVVAKQQEIETAIAIPKGTINLKDMVKSVYTKIKNFFSSGREHPIEFSELLGDKSNIPEERINHFVPLLHLDNQHKILLEQEQHLAEIKVWLKELHNKKFEQELEIMRKEAEIAMQQDMLTQQQEDSYKNQEETIEDEVPERASAFAEKHTREISQDDDRE